MKFGVTFDSECWLRVKLYTGGRCFVRHSTVILVIKLLFCPGLSQSAFAKTDKKAISITRNTAEWRTKQRSPCIMVHKLWAISCSRYQLGCRIFMAISWPKVNVTFILNSFLFTYFIYISCHQLKTLENRTITKKNQNIILNFDEKAGILYFLLREWGQ